VLSSVSGEPPSLAHDPFAPLRVPVYRRYLGGNLLLLIGVQMQLAAVHWEIFSRTQSNLGIAIGSLVQFAPVLLLSIPAGFLADRFSRPRIVRIAMLVMIAGSLLLVVASARRWSLEWLFAGMLLNGMARAAQQPAKASLLPHLVPRRLFPAAVTWNSGAFQVAAVTGPLFAATVIAFASPAAAYFLEAVFAAIFLLSLWGFHEPPDRVRSTDTFSWSGLASGMRFVWKTRLILAAISLDLFAVLLGGAAALLPAYAQTILPLAQELGWVRSWGVLFGYEELDPQAIGFGALRAAPAIGAAVMSLWLALRPPMTRAGRTLLWSVAGFGVATIVFGFSRSFWLSFAMLFLTGLLDTVSVVVRHTLVQLRTPDEMRGRVQAINGVFIGASNELGGFESGAVAHLFARPNDPSFGPTVSVVSGGIGTLIIVALTAWLSPALRRYDLLHEPGEEADIALPAKAAK
jgi:MFS family permease